MLAISLSLKAGYRPSGPRRADGSPAATYCAWSSGCRKGFPCLLWRSGRASGRACSPRFPSPGPSRPRRRRRAPAGGSARSAPARATRRAAPRDPIRGSVCVCWCLLVPMPFPLPPYSPVDRGGRRMPHACGFAASSRDSGGPQRDRQRLQVSLIVATAIASQGS